MKTTTPKKLRSELKTYLDQATKEPIKIKRRSGKNYILISEERYMELAGTPLAIKKQLTPLKGDKHAAEAKVKTTKKKAPATKKSKVVKKKTIKAK